MRNIDATVRWHEGHMKDMNYEEGHKYLESLVGGHNWTQRCALIYGGHTDELYKTHHEIASKVLKIVNKLPRQDENI